MDILTRRQQKTAEVKDGGKKFMATMVAPEPRPIIDEVGLLKALTPEELKAVTVRKIDKKLLESLMDSQEGFIEKVGGFVQLKPTTPYLKFTEGVNDDFTAEGE